MHRDAIECGACKFGATDERPGASAVTRPQYADTVVVLVGGAEWAVQRKKEDVALARAGIEPVVVRGRHRERTDRE